MGNAAKRRARSRSRNTRPDFRIAGQERAERCATHQRGYHQNVKRIELYPRECLRCEIRASDTQLPARRQAETADHRSAKGRGLPCNCTITVPPCPAFGGQIKGVQLAGTALCWASSPEHAHTVDRVLGTCQVSMLGWKTLNPRAWQWRDSCKFEVD